MCPFHISDALHLRNHLQRNFESRFVSKKFTWRGIAPWRKQFRGGTADAKRPLSPSRGRQKRSAEVLLEDSRAESRAVNPAPQEGANRQTPQLEMSAKLSKQSNPLRARLNAEC